MPSANCWSKSHCATARPPTHIKEADADERTVIAVQIENEPGSYGSERDYSSEGNALFAAEAPPAITSLLPTIAASGLHQAWAENGSRTGGA